MPSQESVTVPGFLSTSLGSARVIGSLFILSLGFPGGSQGKESACNVGDLDSIPGLGKSPGGGNDNPLQYSCLENSMERGAWWAAVYGVSQSQT